MRASIAVGGLSSAVVSLVTSLSGCAQDAAPRGVAVTTAALLDSSSCPAGSNVILGTSGNDVLTGTGGADCIVGGPGNDVIHGGAGDDFLVGGWGDDTLYGEDGDDELHGEKHADHLEGGAGNDRLYGGAAADTLLGGHGDDELYGQGHDDYIEGGDGNDLAYGDSGNDVIDLGEGDDFADGQTGQDTLYGGPGHDELRGGNWPDEIHGGDGDDVILGGTHNDLIHGGAGRDVVDGESGYDTIFGDDEDDYLIAGGSGAVDGGAGFDACNGTNCEGPEPVPSGCTGDVQCGGGICIAQVGLCIEDAGDDACPDDPDKTEPGVCGCGVPDDDSDGDGTADCDDSCPYDPLAIDPASCGCTAIAGVERRHIVAGDESLFILVAAEQSIRRWSLALGMCQAPLAIGSGATHIAYSADGMLYVGYDSGQIDAIDPDTGSSAFLVTVPAAPHGLATIDDLVFVSIPNGSWATHYVYAPDGTLLEQITMTRRSREYVWSAASNRMYFFRDGTSPNDLHWEEIDSTSGQLIASGESPYHGDFLIAPPLRVSVDGTRALLGTGDVYDGPTLERTTSLPLEPSDATWLDDGRLLTIRADGSDTLLEQHDSSLALENVASIPGAPVAVLSTVAGVIIITSVDDTLSMSGFTPSLDGDHDGIDFADDAFPLDIAASADSDGDGFPDAWNAGYDETDSTTGLALDAFPLDSACQVPTDAIGGAGGGPCDIAGAIPAYVANSVVVADGVVYLLSTAFGRIFRWSSATSQHLNPIFVGPSPTLMAYSSDNATIYLAYETGALTQIPLAGPLHEQPFAVTPHAPHGLATAGPWVVAADDSGSWDTHFTFSPQGDLISAVDWNRESATYAWSEVNERLYFARDGTSPNDLLWERIDPATGEITDDGESPYHGDYVIRHPIRVSADGARVMLGSGDVYDGLTLEYLASVPVDPDDLAWLADGGVATISSIGPDTELRYFDAMLAPGSSTVLPGAPVRVLELASGLLVVTYDNARPAFHIVPAGWP